MPKWRAMNSIEHTITIFSTFNKNKHNTPKNFFESVEENGLMDQSRNFVITIFCSRSTLWISIGMSSHSVAKSRNVIYNFGYYETVVFALGL